MKSDAVRTQQADNERAVTAVIDFDDESVATERSPSRGANLRGTAQPVVQGGAERLARAWAECDLADAILEA